MEEQGRQPGGAKESEERYEFGETFAVGGLGVIRRAFDHKLGRTIAVKTLQRGDPAALRRFELEARITARLQHPGIVPLHDLGRAPNGEPYYCMKLIEGQSLDRVIAGETTLRGRLRLLEHVLAAADAIAYAHQHGVLHRDIKPANIVVGAHGETVVIDWGLAKDTTGRMSLADEAGRDVSEDGDPTQTVAGTIVGTLRYMPPEQARGELADQRSDVFALGAVLFHVLAGRPPHARLERALLLDRLVAGEIEDLRPLASEAPRELVAIAQKAMSPRPGDRYVGAAEMAEDLRRFLAGRLVDAHRYQPGELLRLWLRRHRAAAVAGALGVLALAIASAAYVRGVQAAQLAAEAARGRAEAAEAEASRRANAALLAQAQGVLGEDPAEALRVLAQVDLRDDGDLRRTRLIAQAAVARGAPERVLRGHGHAIERLAPLADGGLVSVDTGGAVWKWNLGTGRGEQVIDLQSPLGWVVAAADAPVWAAISARHGVVFRGDAPPETIDVSATPAAQGVWYATHRWELSRGGETLAALGWRLLAGPARPAAYAWDLTAQPARSHTLPFDQVGTAALSPDGRTIAVANPRRRTVLVTGEAQVELQELGIPRAFSPSGSYLVAGETAMRLSDRSPHPLGGGLLGFTRDDLALVRRPKPNFPPQFGIEPQLVLLDPATGETRWERDLYGSNEQRHALHGDDGGMVVAERGDRFAIRFDGRWTLWWMASGVMVRSLAVGGRGRAAFTADGGFVATHERDLWWWPADAMPDVSKDMWLVVAPDDSHALVGSLAVPAGLERVRARDGARTPIRCPMALDRKYRQTMPLAVDGQGRVLAAGLPKDACLIAADGTARQIATEAKVTAVALAERAPTFALGLADGSVLAFTGGAEPRRWQLPGAVEALWALHAGGDLIAATETGTSFALHVGDDEPIALASADTVARARKPRVALDPDGTAAALILASEDGLLFYDDGAVRERPMALPFVPLLAFSPSGVLGIATPGPAVRFVAGPDDPGREVVVPEPMKAMAFVDDETLAIEGEEGSLIRVDTVLGVAIVLQPEYAVLPLGLGLLAPRRGYAPGLYAEPGGRIDDVPRDRDGLRAWLSARTR
nr:serine/threonine-protein kinase [Nannocystis sp. SCPEA4]